MLLTVDFPSLAYLRLSPDGTRLALTNDGDVGELLILELPSGKRVARYSGLRARPLADFRSESELVIAHGTACWLCDLATNGHRALDLAADGGEPGWLHCCRVSPDGKSVALGGWRGGLLIAGIEGHGPRLVKLPYEGSVAEVYFSPDSKFVAVVIAPRDEDRELRLVAALDVQTGKAVRVLKFPWDQFFDYPSAFRPDNQVLAVGWRDKVLLFDLYPPKSPLDPDVLFGDGSLHSMGWPRPTAGYALEGRKEVRGAWFSREGIVLKALSERGDAVLMAVDEEQVIQTTRPPIAESDKLWGAEITAGGRAAAKAGDNTVLVWDVPGWGEA
jgi:WD40 repeat protein